MSSRLPHPIPYQGSKRVLAPLIGHYVPDRIRTWYEPFAGPVRPRTLPTIPMIAAESRSSGKSAKRKL